MVLEVRFMGIFLLVRPRDGADQVARILIPNCIDPPVHEDGDAAEKHYPFLVRDDQAVHCVVPKSPTSAFDIHRKEISFRFDPDQAPGTTAPAGLNWDQYQQRPLIQMRSKVSDQLQLRQNLSPFDTPDARLGARITLDRGAFSTCKADGTASKYVLRGKLIGQDVEITEGISLVCTIDGLDDVFVDYKSAENGPWETLHLRDAGSGVMRLTIGNLCADSPSKWSTCAASPCRHGESIDHDFKWLYRLFTYNGGDWPDDLHGYFPVPVGICADATARGATTSTCWGGDCGDFC